MSSFKQFPRAFFSPSAVMTNLFVGRSDVSRVSEVVFPLYLHVVKPVELHLRER